MNDKPIIRYSSDYNSFYDQNGTLSDEEVRQHWDNCDAEWSQRAYQEMSKIILNCNIDK